MQRLVGLPPVEGDTPQSACRHVAEEESGALDGMEGATSELEVVVVGCIDANTPVRMPQIPIPQPLKRHPAGKAVVHAERAGAEVGGEFGCASHSTIVSERGWQR